MEAPVFWATPDVAVCLLQRLAKKLATVAGTPEGIGPEGQPVGAPDGRERGNEPLPEGKGGEFVGRARSLTT